MRLDQRKILITGGGPGIGLELAKALAPANDVVIAGRDVGKLERAKAGLPALHIFRLDITSEDEARAAVDWLTNRLGGVVIVTAGYTPTLRWQIKSLEADGPCSYISRSPPGQCVQNLCKIS